MSEHHGIRVNVVENFPALGLDVYIGRGSEGQRQLWRPQGWDALIDASVQVDPSLTLPTEAAKGLLDAMLEHYRGGTDARLLRGDYEAERKRVDKLLDTVSKIAERSDDQ
jgi:hypothetical protein